MSTTVINEAPPPPKQIRFVNNPGQPPQKRRRINAACLTCRKRKTRCAGEKPICSTCAKNNHDCLGYRDLAERRKDNGHLGGAKPEQPDGVSSLNDVVDDDYQGEEEDEQDDQRRHWKAANHGAMQQSHQYGSGDSLSRCDSESTLDSASAPPMRHVKDEWDLENGRQQQQQQQQQHQPPRQPQFRPPQRPREDPRRPLPPPPQRQQQHQPRQLHHHQQQQQQQHLEDSNHGPSHPRRTYSDRARHSASRSPTRHHTQGHRVPYFRYFGATAIVPGFKQMLGWQFPSYGRDRRKSRGLSFSKASPGSLVGHNISYRHSSQTDAIVESLDDLPAYDPNDSSPVHPLILSLLKTFFIHLGCNYPFIKEEKTMRLVREKRLEPILVDAMCSLAARFSELPVFAQGSDGSMARSEYGHVFAQRAKAATVDAFPCPSVPAIQAYLLMAYEGFGANQDSGLWMYLGLAIRMVVDLGLQTVVGVSYQGERDPWYTRNCRRDSDGPSNTNRFDDQENQLSQQEQKEVEQERIDTFWSVFVLDRVISSGTGRPVTFRDDDFELALPEPTVDLATGCPDPFPSFILIIHLYGRVSDVLNNVKKPEDLTEDRLGKLIQMEHDLTQIYQKQHPRLNFNVTNFKQYVSTGQATSFILLHFWFHALIIVLHQPTVHMRVDSLSRIHQLFPNSRELAMSSAKTITDILAFAELIDPKSFIGNPFTSQPMYIAACAFLEESLANASMPASREPTPPTGIKLENPRTHTPRAHYGAEAKSAKHSLLASAANQNYQRCYKSLQQLNQYWSGVSYILTALDQKSKGIWDCETYTFEEYESAKLPRRSALDHLARYDSPSSPNVPNAPPIAMSLTGTTNSPNSSLTLLYQNMGNNAGNSQATIAQHVQAAPPTSVPISVSTPPGNMIYDPIRQSLPDPQSLFQSAYPQPNVSALRHSVQSNKREKLPSSPLVHPQQFRRLHVSDYERDHAMAGSSPGSDSKSQIYYSAGPSNHETRGQQHSYTPTSQHSSNYEQSGMPDASPNSAVTDGGSHLHDHHGHHQSHHHQHDGSDSGSAINSGNGYHSEFAQSGLASGSYSFVGSGGPITEVTFEGTDIEFGSLGLPSEMMPPWLEFVPGEVLGGLFENGLDRGGTHGHMG